MHRRSSFDFEVTAVNREFANCSEIVTCHSDLSRNRDLPRDSMQAEIARNTQVVLVVAGGFARNVRAAEDDVGVLRRLQNDFAQLLVDDLLLGLGKDTAGPD